MPGSRDYRRWFVLLLALAVSVLFFYMVRQFLMPVFLAAVISGVVQPIHRRVARRLGGRRTAAAALTLLAVVILFLGPVLAFFGIVAGQALKIAETAVPWVKQQLQQPSEFERLLFERVPFLEQLAPYRDQIVSALGGGVEKAGSYLFGSLSSLTRGTALFLLDLFIFLYAMFFFVRDGKGMLEAVLDHAPLTHEERERLLHRFVEVANAILKGTLVIGLLQGGLAAGAFAVAGIPDVAFWGVVMVVLSIVPGVGSALVWVPAVGYLLIQDRAAAAVALAIWCAAVVGSIDNFLRPRLVGSGSKMSDLMVLLATLGGLAFFGAAGFIVGPILAAVFVTLWGFYREHFRELLAEPSPAPAPASIPTVPGPPPPP